VPADPMHGDPSDLLGIRTFEGARAPLSSFAMGGQLDSHIRPHGACDHDC
jgi:hypothetical protein